MITFGVGSSEKASRIAAQAQAALNEGDTARAQTFFRQAAEELERQILGVRKQRDKDMLRFLTASQYYHGGLYAEAQRLCRRVQASLLPTDARTIFHKFVGDVNDRADLKYRKRIHAALLRHYQKNEYQGILSLLQQHPYVLTPDGLAFMRATSCERIKDYKAAALFFADTIRFAPESAQVLFTSAAFPIRFLQEGSLDTAWEYVSYQLKVIPHALTSINASLVRYHQATRSGSNEERTNLSTEQIRYFEDAWRRFQLLPPSFQGNAELQDYMILCFEAAAFGYLRLDQPEAARDLSDRMIALFPGVPAPLKLRDLLTSPTSRITDGADEDYLYGRERTIRQKQESTMPALGLIAA